MPNIDDLFMIAETVMQELTAAYRNHDLHTLLRLELEWIRREEGDLDRITRGETEYLQQRPQGTNHRVGAGVKRNGAASPLSTDSSRWTV
jgi:hypothetical protein